MNRQYVCTDCGFSMYCKDEPVYCPKCGQATLTTDNVRAWKYALVCKSRCQELLPELEAKYADFMETYVVYEDSMQVLRQYKKRGILSDDDLPTLFKPRLADSLKEYRRKKREAKDDV